MKIYSINSVHSQIGFGKNNTRTKTNIPTHSSSPLKESLTTAGVWFAFGVGLDFISRKISFFKSPTKNSFAINGLIATTAGVVAGYKSASRKH